MLKEQFRHLDGNKAVGIDRVTKASWGEQLDENISGLLQRLRRGTYCPNPAKITEIPKEDGSSRPLAIPIAMENSVNVQVSLNMCGDTDLSGAGCGSPASPVLRRGPSG